MLTKSNTSPCASFCLDVR